MPKQEEGTVASRCSFGQSMSDLMGGDCNAVYHVADFDSFVAIAGPLEDQEESIDLYVCKLILETLTDEEIRNVTDRADVLLEETSE